MNPDEVSKAELIELVETLRHRVADLEAELEQKDDRIDRLEARLRKYENPEWTAGTFLERITAPFHSRLTYLGDELARDAVWELEYSTVEAIDAFADRDLCRFPLLHETFRCVVDGVHRSDPPGLATVPRIVRHRDRVTPPWRDRYRPVQFHRLDGPTCCARKGPE